MGTAKSGLTVTAQSWQGSVTVELHAGDVDMVTVRVCEGSGEGGRAVFFGSLKELLALPNQSPHPPQCVQAMGCLCAAHAKGRAAEGPCDAILPWRYPRLR